jgi:hypothetical protein
LAYSGAAGVIYFQRAGTLSRHPVSDDPAAVRGDLALHVEWAIVLRIRNEKVINDQAPWSIHEDVELAEARLAVDSGW